MSVSPAILGKIVAGYQIVANFFTLTGGTDLILENNPNRWSFLIGGPGGIFVAPTNSLGGGTNGFEINPPFGINVRDYASLPMIEWFAFGLAGQSILIVETIKL